MYFKNRIAVVFESFVRAGSQRHLVEILKGIRLFRPDLDCSLFLISRNNNSWATFKPEVHQAGISVVEHEYKYSRLNGEDLGKRIYNLFSRLWFERYMNNSFYNKLRAFDAVVTPQPYVADLLRLTLRSEQRLCFHFSEHPAQRHDTSCYRLLTRNRLNVIYQHPNQLSQLKNFLSPNPVLVWPLRLCPDNFSDPGDPGDPGDPSDLNDLIQDSSHLLRITHYSRISPMRLIDQVIDSFALLHHRIPARLRIAGYIEDPAYHNLLLSQVQRLGLDNMVEFVDPVLSPADDPARSEVDLVWMISLSGHIGYASLEAMASGLPTLLLEVDSLAQDVPPDPELRDLICSTPVELVERTLALYADIRVVTHQQSQLVRNRFMMTKNAIDELTSFYLGLS
jgi:glycosyltransferase involved in cell wall biosynthesis